MIDTGYASKDVQKRKIDRYKKKRKNKVPPHTHSTTKELLQTQQNLLQKWTRKD
jgi:hypothetical protein